VHRVFSPIAWPQWEAVLQARLVAGRWKERPLAADAFTEAFTLKAGSPVVALPENTDGISVIPPFPGGQFRGVLLDDLPYNLNGDQTSRLAYEGVLRVNLYIPTASAAVKGASLIPVNGAFSTGVSCFKVQANASSPFRLLEDLTGQTNGDFLLVDGSQQANVNGGNGALIEIAPHTNYCFQYAPNTQSVGQYGSSLTITASGNITLAHQFPDIPRNGRTVSDGATTAAFDSTWTGYSVTGEEITETISVSTTNGTITPGTKIFARVTNIANATPDASTVVSYGYGLLFQLPKTSNGKPDMIDAYADGTREGTAPTFAVDADEVEKNTISFNTAPDGSKCLRCTFNYGG